ncbi:hypothetical protein FGO68_gene4088 [Halteria grandinella]|uniref:Uncharacterized protein n=1 Tax=Halteria grandinella TaxID=5974 RepID=A0A8J8NY94_HALGN|nr:hypothetical protein FGO68_gene4088 [Halteria grandinella]
MLTQKYVRYNYNFIKIKYCLIRAQQSIANQQENNKGQIQNVQRRIRQLKLSSLSTRLDGASRQKDSALIIINKLHYMQKLAIQTRKPLPPSLIHLISQYIASIFQFKVFSKLNKRTRRDLVTLISRDRTLTLEIPSKHSIPILINEQFLYLKSFAKHFKIVISTEQLFHNDKNINKTDEYVKPREVFKANVDRVCKFFKSFDADQLFNYTLSLKACGKSKIFDNLTK